MGNWGIVIRIRFSFTFRRRIATISRVMAGKIIINTERCKGCGLCVVVCPHNCIRVSEKSNKKGYFPAESDSEDCTGCAMCAIICPDVVITVQTESNIVEFSGKDGKTRKSKLPEQEAGKLTVK